MKVCRLGSCVLVAALAVVGCAQTAPGGAPAAPAAAPGPAGPQPAAPSAAPAVPAAAPAEAPDAREQPKGVPAQRSVYFDFDQWTIREPDARLIEAHAAYLADHASRTVRIEGNCDERGGREYNLALAQRRANAVRLRLMALGVATERIETISLGKEKPRNPGHDEDAWAENRRSDIIYAN